MLFIYISISNKFLFPLIIVKIAVTEKIENLWKVDTFEWSLGCPL